MKLSTTLTISPQGQITLPKVWRQNLGKQVIAWITQNNGTTQVTLTPEPQTWSDYSLGLGKKVWQDLDAAKYVKAERQSWEQSHE